MPAQQAFSIPVIAIEGIDGAGKTTLIDALRTDPELRRFAFTGEFASPVGRMLRETKGWHEDPVLKLHLFAADRACIFRELASLSPQPPAVVWDRYVASAVVYREAERLAKDWPYGGEDATAVNAVFPKAATTILLELDPAEAGRRKPTIPGVSAEAARLYSEMALKDPSWCVVDAARSAEQVRSDVKEIILACA